MYNNLICTYSSCYIRYTHLIVADVLYTPADVLAEVAIVSVFVMYLVSVPWCTQCNYGCALINLLCMMCVCVCVLHYIIF